MDPDPDSIGTVGKSAETDLGPIRVSNSVRGGKDRGLRRDGRPREERNFQPGARTWDGDGCANSNCASQSVQRLIILLSWSHIQSSCKVHYAILTADMNSS